jgi:hypothetical protein
MRCEITFRASKTERKVGEDDSYDSCGFVGFVAVGVGDFHHRWRRDSRTAGDCFDPICGSLHLKNDSN